MNGAITATRTITNPNHLHRVAYMDEVVMYEFEVRVLKEDHKPSLILPGPHASVLTALKTARQLAKEGDILEVWRDFDRVHREQLALSRTPTARNPADFEPFSLRGILPE
jgi:hypothetical protein